jgi:hypothetical protein
MIIASVLKCLGIVAIVVVAGINILFLTAWGVLLWIASGESDVNGDPERDAGILEPHAPPQAAEVRSLKSEWEEEPRITRITRIQKN